MVHPDEEPGTKGTTFQLDELNIKNTLYVPDFTIEQREGKKTELDYIPPNVVDHNVTRKKEYGANDTYKHLMDSLCQKFDACDIYYFSYDWRQSNSNSAQILNKFIYSLINKGHSKVNLICHSMGGLVASSMVSQFSEVKSKINKIITFGTPYEGAVNLLRATLTGNVMEFETQPHKTVGNPLIWLSGMTKNVKLHLPGVIQLTPSVTYAEKVPQSKVYQMIDDSTAPAKVEYVSKEIKSGEYKEICAEIFEKNPDYNDILNFQDSISDGLLSLSNCYFGMGGAQRTLRSVILKRHLQNAYEDEPYVSLVDCIDLTFENQGDGTVPYLSANKLEKINANSLGKERVKYFASSHTDVAAAEIPVLWGVEILKNGISDLGSNTALGNGGYEVVRLACPVDIFISNGIQSLNSGAASISSSTDFGEMIFLGHKGDIKLACLDVDNYTIQLQGTDTGTMDYSLRCFDADNAVIETRDLYDVPVTKDTLIITDTNMEEPTVLVDKKRPWEKHEAKVTKHYKSTSSKIPQILHEYKEFTADDAVELYNNAEIIDDIKTIDLSEYDILPLDVAKAWLVFAENDKISLNIISSQLIKDDKENEENISTVMTTLKDELTGDIMLKPAIYLTQSESQYIEFPLIVLANVIIVDTGEIAENNQPINIQIPLKNIPLSPETFNIYSCGIFGKLEKLNEENWSVVNNNLNLNLMNTSKIVVSENELF